MLADSGKGKPDVILMSTGSEVQFAVAAHEKLVAAGIRSRVVSLPSFELFNEQPAAYRNEVLPPAVTARVAIEAGVKQCWDQYLGSKGVFIGLDTYGASAPYPGNLQAPRNHCRSRHRGRPKTLRQVTCCDWGLLPRRRYKNGCYPQTGINEAIHRGFQPFLPAQSRDKIMIMEVAYRSLHPTADFAMQRRPFRRIAWFALLLLVILAPHVSRGANVLNELPNDALGFVLIHNLSTVDAKVGQLGALLQRNIPRPIAFLKEFAGVGEGLNPDGDVLLALFPESHGSGDSLVYCVWLPVTDYDRFLASLGATPIDGIAAATVAGEDLLVAQHGNWALVMDPDQHERIVQLASAPSTTPPMPPWNKWIEANDVTVVAYPPGVRALAQNRRRQRQERRPQPGRSGRSIWTAPAERQSPCRFSGTPNTHDLGLS